MPSEIQEANARLASCAPTLLAALNRCAILLADYDEHDGEEGDAYRDAIAPPSPRLPREGRSHDHQMR